MTGLYQELNPQGAYTDLSALLRCRFGANDLTLFAHQPARSLLSGSERSRFRGRGMDFEEVRHYQPGDDVRSIDWRVTARTQITHTKIFKEERERPVLLVVDQRAPLFFGSVQCFKSVLAAHIAAFLAWAALGNGDRLGAIVLGDDLEREVKPRRSKHAVLELLHVLNDMNHLLTSPIATPSESRKALSQRLVEARRLAKPGTAVFIISDFNDLDAECEQSLFELKRHTDLTLIQVYDPLEQTLNAKASLALSNGQERFQVDAGSRQFQQAYTASFDGRNETIMRICRQLGLPLLRYATNDDIVAGLQKAYGKRKR